MIKEYTLNEKRFFYIGNDVLSCILEIAFGKLELLHIGASVRPEDALTYVPCLKLGWGTDVLYKKGETEACLDNMPLAWSESGTGDYRESPVQISLDGETVTPDFVFKSAEIISGDAPALSVLPRAEGATETLMLTFTSDNSLLEGLELDLYFSLFETALTRRAVLRSSCEKTVSVTKLMSALFDLRGCYEMTSFDGGWIREACPHKTPVTGAAAVNESINGFSSNRHNPGFLLSEPAAGEDCGEVYGFNLLWSGNHYASARRSPIGFTRVQQGISPDGLCISLVPGGFLEAPEAVVSFSNEGFNGLSRNMHRFVNSSIVPKAWRGKERPVLYNSWEGSLFSFTESSILALARKAKKLGCELFVLDDGWFGARNDDTAGLGDYNVNRKKLPQGIDGLAKRINALGLDFGLWFEPEAVNPDSDCYRAHPDWALISPGGKELLGRNELLLDLTNPDVRDYIVSSVSSVLSGANISYVKWDMNRCSPVTGTKAYEYILGLYDILHRIFDPRPDILLEGCASGGNRFDLGMLCFAPQIWASDNTDPIERLSIQKGLSYLYPQSTMGAHISEAPHSQTLRATPLSTRANVSFFGDFGIEFDLNHMLSVDEAELADAVAFYKEHRHAFQFGEFRRNPAEEGAECWQVTDGEKMLCGLFHRLLPAGPGMEWLRTRVPDKAAGYSVSARPQLLRVGKFGNLLKYVSPVEINPNGMLLRTADRHYKMYDGGFSAECSGAALEAGIPLSKRFSGTGYDKDIRTQGDFLSNLFVIEKKKQEPVPDTDA